ncbi:MAG: hypothetical protein ACP5J1_05535 [Fervidicoccaceae archaeon]
MWFYVGVSFMALLSMLDMAIFTYIGFTFRVSPIYYSVVAASWSIVYIIVNKFLSGLGNSGRNKSLMGIAFFSITSSLILFSGNTLYTVTLAYMFHAVAVSSANLAMSTSIYELFDSSAWSKYSTLQRILQNLLRGSTLIVISSGIVSASLYNVLMLASLLGALSLLILPPITLGIERKLHMLGKGVNSLIGFASSRGILTAAIDSVGDMSSRALGFWNSSRTVPSRGRIMVSVLLAVATGDFVFTAMPLLVKTSLPLSEYWMAQGITGITVAVGGLVISRMLSGNRKVAISIIALRGLWLSLAMPLMYKEETLILYLIGMYFLGLAMDASLFNLYSESSSGYGTHSYFISRELGTLIGSLLAGLVLASGIKEAIFIFPIIFTVSSAIQLL